MATGNVVIVVSKHPASKYSRMVRSLLSQYDVVVLVARGRHVSRLSDVLRALRGSVRIVSSSVSYADYAPEFTVMVSSGGATRG